MPNPPASIDGAPQRFVQACEQALQCGRFDKLVLAGYRSIDERTNRPYEEEEVTYRAAPEVRAAAPVASQPAAPQPAQPAQPKKPSGAGKFFQDIISRTKGLLIDDFDDKQY